MSTILSLIFMKQIMFLSIETIFPVKSGDVMMPRTLHFLYQTSKEPGVSLNILWQGTSGWLCLKIVS